MSEWSRWYDHDGLGYPVPAGTYVHTIDGEGKEDYLFVMRNNPSFNAWDFRQSWYKDNPQWGVIRYRIRRPKGLTILTDILREVENTKQPEYTN